MTQFFSSKFHVIQRFTVKRSILVTAKTTPFQTSTVVPSLLSVSTSSTFGACDASLGYVRAKRGDSNSPCIKFNKHHETYPTAAKICSQDNAIVFSPNTADRQADLLDFMAQNRRTSLI